MRLAESEVRAFERMPEESKVFVLDDDDEVEDEYGAIMGEFVREAEKDVLSQVRGRVCCLHAMA
eukprot:COSAG01_NODE_11178_length_1989_cov_1.797354_4_plen_64_part_00